MARWMAIGRCSLPSSSMYVRSNRSGSIVRSTWMVAICHSRPERVIDVDVDLGRVERAVLGLDDVRQRRPVERLLDERLGPLPQRRVAERLVRLRREREARRQAEPRVRLADLAEERLELVRQLVRADVDVARRPG